MSILYQAEGFRKTPSPSTPCCAPDSAWYLVGEVAWMALRGEAPPYALAGAVDHALRMGQVGVPR